MIFYNHEDKEILNAYNALEYSRSINNFTAYGNPLKAVFILESISTEDKFISLLHETAHIFLGHIEKDINTTNARKNESEAEAFVYHVLNYRKKSYIKPLICVILALICAVILLGVKSGYIPAISITPERMHDAQHQEEMVYITSSGNKFHRKECIHTIDKDCTALTYEQAAKNYEPCNVCNP